MVRLIYLKVLRGEVGSGSGSYNDLNLMFDHFFKVSNYYN